MCMYIYIYTYLVYTYNSCMYIYIYICIFVFKLRTKSILICGFLSGSINRALVYYMLLMLLYSVIFCSSLLCSIIV